MHSDFSVTDAQFALKPPHALGQYNFLNKNVEAVYRWQVFRKKSKSGGGGNFSRTQYDLRIKFSLQKLNFNISWGNPAKRQ